jgi:hypothetical protein
MNFDAEAAQLKQSKSLKIMTVDITYPVKGMANRRTEARIILSCKAAASSKVGAASKARSIAKASAGGKKRRRRRGSKAFASSSKA